MLDRSASFIIAATLFGIAATVALISGTNIAIILLFAACGVSGFYLLYRATSIPLLEPRISYAPAEEWAAVSFLHHRDFALWIDQESEPVIGIEDGTVSVANNSAISLLGRHIVGADVRTAIRHPAAAELLDQFSRGDIILSPVNLIDYPRAGHRWTMRIARLSKQEAILFLSDRSAIDTADRMRSDFVANASHELRTPLAAILGYVETLEDMVGDDAPLQSRFLGIIDREAKRMQRLVLDLLSISRVEADRFRRPTEPVDLSQVALATLNQLKESAEARPQDLVVDISDEAICIKGDKGQLAQLIHNIIANAMKYGEKDTPIHVSLKRDFNRAILSIKDQGQGISADHLPRLTERFYRVDDARSRSVGGTGLGLAIVKHIAERHQGHLMIDSIVGEGTTVTLSFPIDQS